MPVDPAVEVALDPVAGGRQRLVRQRRGPGRGLAGLSRDLIGLDGKGLRRAAETEGPADDRGAGVIDEIEELSDDEVDRLLAKRMGRTEP